MGNRKRALLSGENNLSRTEKENNDDKRVLRPLMNRNKS